MYLAHMKTILSILAFTFLSNLSFGQAFHFDLTERTLVKTVAQSPAHWYLDIFSDVPVDTTLRWKSYFSNIPVQWDINFDDQNTNYTFVQSGDSADFTLYTGLSQTQKLIIGSEFNGIPGEGSTFFDVYDPNDLSTQVTIRFKFIVSSLGISEQQADEWIKQKGATFEFGSEIIGNHIQLVSLDGRSVYDGEISSMMDFANLSSEHILVLVIETNDGPYTRKVYLN